MYQEKRTRHHIRKEQQTSYMVSGKKGSDMIAWKSSKYHGIEVRKVGFMLWKWTLCSKSKLSILKVSFLPRKWRSWLKHVEDGGGLPGQLCSGIPDGFIWPSPLLQLEYTHSGALLPKCDVPALCCCIRQTQTITGRYSGFVNNKAAMHCMSHGIG